ncbi:suppressor of fused domain protein [Streptomyces sp. HC307]|uniref:suppressor of fused domain protein n=1 Tax=Streptomyces flavusporus TaxID=3385496 RepID=UPI0039171800
MSSHCFPAHRRTARLDALRQQGLQPGPFEGGALQGCSAYPAAGHWHYVTYGLSELYAPHEDDDPEWSGWGFELTLRVRRGAEERPPQWPYGMLQEVAKYVNGSQVLLEDGHRIDFRQPVTGHPHLEDAPATALTVFAFTTDPQLGTIDPRSARSPSCRPSA